MGADRWLVAGLGNPGTRYEGTRHNLGFDVVREFASNCGAANWKQERDALLSSSRLANGKQVMLALPQTFMNRSGEVIAPLARYYDISPEQVVVAHDEVDLALGVMRIKFGGGDGGHNGIKSICTHLATSDFIRVRCGIGRPADSRFQVADYVLGRFTADQTALIDALQKQAAKAIESLITQGLKMSQNEFNKDS